MTLQELYDLLRRDYPEHFPDEGFEDATRNGGGGGWRVNLPLYVFQLIL